MGDKDGMRDPRFKVMHLQPMRRGLGSATEERVGFDTQKPEALLERIIRASSNAGELVADFFCGSGTTLAVAEKLGRRWVGCDLGRWGVHVTRKRLLGIQNCKPFEVLNLGRYERQYWQGVTFGEKKDKSLTEQALYEYLAFILKLYGAQPVAGMAHLHGKKGKAMVHIGAVDAPVTIAEIDAAVNECAKLKQSELHVLGWEWEKRHPVALICDEAHIYLPRDGGNPNEERAIACFEKVAKEGRKYGVSLIVVSQRPSDVNATILSQCNNVVALRLTNSSDQLVVNKLMPESLAALLEMLPILDVGEALFVGDAVLLPSRIRMKPPDEKPISATIDFWTEWSKAGKEPDWELAAENMRRQRRRSS